MYKQFEKALNLVKKTGDRLILYNTQNDEDAHVVMSLNEYEQMVGEGYSDRDVKGLTEEELIDKINRDIAIWKSDQEAGLEPKVSEPATAAAETPEEKVSEPKAEPAQDRQAENASAEPGAGSGQEDASDKKDKRRNYWGIPQDRKQGAAEIVEEEGSDRENDQNDPDDEDRQYLEEITF